MTEQGLKRCPFCWSLNCRIEEANGWPRDSGKYVFCPECWETGPILPEDAAADEVVEAWNYQFCQKTKDENNE